MKTQLSFNRVQPFSRVIVDALEHTFIVAVITDTDINAGLGVATAITAEFKTFDKDVQLMDLSDTIIHNKAFTLTNPEILVVNCPVGVNATNIDVANHADTIVIVPSLVSVPHAITGCFLVMKDLLKESRYTDKFNIIISNAQNDKTGLQAYNGLGKVVESFCSVLTELLGIVTVDMNERQKMAVFNQAAHQLLRNL